MRRELLPKTIGIACILSSVAGALAQPSSRQFQPQLVPAPPPIPGTVGPGIQYAEIEESKYVRKDLPKPAEDTQKLNSKEQKGVALAEQWKDREDMPFLGDNGSVQFVFGTTLPSVVCAPYYACDVALQPGETVSQIIVGDSNRWKVSPGVSGKGATAVTHLVIKTNEPGLATNLVVHTDRRSYNIHLVSKKDKWMPLVSFSYPDDSQKQWESYYKEHEEHPQRLKARVSTTRLASGLNFNYRVRGDSVHWKPLRVYSDKSKTYIQFPADLKNDQAPALVLLDRNRQQLVNYRLLGDKYVVDHVIDRAALIKGVGKNQEHVEILREGS